MSEGMIAENDVLGIAYMDYSVRHKNEKIVVESSFAPIEHLPVSYFFRDYEQMPKIEKKALSLCKGKVLDVGGGAGCHALVLQRNKLDVEAIDISPLAVEVMRSRGVKKVYCSDVLHLENKKYDTILMLMNGIGVVKNIEGLDLFFEKAKMILSDQGQILIESTDISYLMHDEEGNMKIDLSKGYFGEITYKLSYKDIKGDPFNWLYIDYKTLEESALNSGLKSEFICEEEDGNFLCRIFRK